MSRELRRVYGVPVGGVVDGEKKPIIGLLEDGYTSRSKAPEPHAFEDDRFQKGLGGICYWKKLIFVERRGWMRQVGVSTVF